MTRWMQLQLGSRVWPQLASCKNLIHRYVIKGGVAKFCGFGTTLNVTCYFALKVRTLYCMHEELAPEEFLLDDEEEETKSPLLDDEEEGEDEDAPDAPADEEEM